MTDYKVLMVKELRTAKENYEALRRRVEEVKIELAKTDKRIRLIQKLLALEEPEKRAS